MAEQYTDYGKLVNFLAANGGKRVGTIGIFDDITYEAVEFPGRSLIVGYDKNRKVGVWVFQGIDGEPVEKDIERLTAIARKATK